MFTRSAPPTRPCYVYAALDAAGTVIYVGISCDFERRWREHETDKPWAFEIADWLVLGEYATEGDARVRETALIRELCTRWNIDESPVADEVRARYLSMFGCVPGAKPQSTPYASTLAWPLRFLLGLGRVLLVVGYVLVVKVVWRLFWCVLSFSVRLLLGWLFGGSRRRRRRR